LGLIVSAGLRFVACSQALSHHCRDAEAFACSFSGLGRYHLSLGNLVIDDSSPLTILTPCLARTLGLHR